MGVGEKSLARSGAAFQSYAARRRKQKEAEPRRILADFLIGAHALVSGYKLLTLDARMYQASFPRLAITDLVKRTRRKLKCSRVDGLFFRVFERANAHIVIISLDARLRFKNVNRSPGAMSWLLNLSKRYAISGSHLERMKSRRTYGKRRGVGGSGAACCATTYQRSAESGTKCYGCDGAAEATAVLPMASPLTTSSTRRLRWRPSAVFIGWRRAGSCRSRGR